MNPQVNSSPVPRYSPGGRQPLLWAALAFAAGIATGVYAWRPPLWWVMAFVVFTASGSYLSWRRGRSAFILGLGTLLVLGALIIQVSSPGSTDDSGLLKFVDGSEVMVTAHVTKEGVPQEEGSVDVRQRLDLETEQIVKANERFDIRSGLRVSVYAQPAKREFGQGADLTAVRLFHYGERLRFPARLSAPRNFRNPGAFDYRAYLMESGITALGFHETGEC